MKEHPYKPDSKQQYIISIYLRHVDAEGKPIHSKEQLSYYSLATLQAMYQDLKPSQTPQERRMKRKKIKADIKSKTSRRE